MDPTPTDNLKDDSLLERSEIVANIRMNRERNVVGNNSYAKDLGINPLVFLRERLHFQPQVSWLDLCCGTGNALIQAALAFEQDHLSARVSLVGIDLVDMFYPLPTALPSLRLQAASVASWIPETSFDLITCVHGLHYVGDKLDLLRRAASWLKEQGTFLAHLDYANLRLADGKPLATLGKDLKRAGLTYNSHRHLLTCQGRRVFELPYHYLGADDQAGPNYTGQPAVNSYYRRIKASHNG
ncbi:MAG TPA: class I SAM-dependent methyltransferase [Chthonomonadaceae bacterium]|nr:class I SAM-dependent methyltransferase [Chthonomonadaceae bacterium]